ncbi:MAG: hypothetical protein ABIA63_12860 [bacterium]
MNNSVIYTMPFNFIKYPIILKLFLLNLLLLHTGCFREYKTIPFRQIYNITQLGDTIFFSTASRGIFKFSRKKPETIKPAACKRNIPFRSIAFTGNNTLIAGSYRTGLHYLKNEALLPLKNGRALAWSIILDSEGTIWMAGPGGVFYLKDDSLIRFIDLHSAHDIAIMESTAAVAHAGGIAIYNKTSARLLKEYCMGINFWCLKKYGNVIIGGGKNLLVIIDENKSFKEIRFGPENNMVWSIAKKKNGAIFFGTQKGLFKLTEGSSKAGCAGFRGQCIKSVFVDSSDQLWVGRFK